MSVPQRPERVHFGGNSPKKLEWTPLPLMQQYLDKRSEERAPSSVALERMAMVHFARFCAEEDIRHPVELERKHLHRFEIYLQGVRSWRGDLLSETYRQTLLLRIKGWVTWAFKEGYLHEDPWAMIKIASIPRRKAKPLEHEELSRIFEAHKQHAFVVTPFYYHRREVILALLYGWGLRLSELTSLTVTAMDLRLDEVVVKKANGDTKKMPYGDELKGIIQRWLRVRGAKARRGEDALLIDREGYPLSEAMIANILRELGSKAGVALTTKRFRDTYGATLAENSVPQPELMKMLGVSDAREARVFLKSEDSEVKKLHKLVIDPLLGRYLGG